MRVFAFEGEGGLTAGASHETKNSAWGLGLDNLVYVVDWNDFGIDDHPVSSVVHGTPEDWFRPYGWRVSGTEHGSDFAHVHPVLAEAIHGESKARRRWSGSRRARDAAISSTTTRATVRRTVPRIASSIGRRSVPFAEKYGVDFDGFGQPEPTDPKEFRKQTETNLRKVIEVLHRDQELVDYLAGTLVRIGDSIPREIDGFRLGRVMPEGGTTPVSASVSTSAPTSTSTPPRTPTNDPNIVDFRSYPESLWAKPGEKQPNRAALGKWGAWVNSYCGREYGRPLFLAMSADLAGSTNIAGFADGWEELPGWGKYDRVSNPEGALLPQEITEFTNAGISAGIATVNFAEDPYRGVRWLLRGVLDLRKLLLPEVRADAALQPARPGLPAQGRQGALDRGSLRPGDGRR